MQSQQKIKDLTFTLRLTHSKEILLLLRLLSFWCRHRLLNVLSLRMRRNAALAVVQKTTVMSFRQVSCVPCGVRGTLNLA